MAARISCDAAPVPDSQSDPYIFTQQQVKMEEEYLHIIKTLIEAGYKAKYIRLFTWETTQNPGYIQLELDYGFESIPGGNGLPGVGADPFVEIGKPV